MFHFVDIIQDVLSTCQKKEADYQKEVVTDWTLVARVNFDACKRYVQLSAVL